MLRFVRRREIWLRASQMQQAVPEICQRALRVLWLCSVLAAALACSPQLAVAQFAQQGPKLVGTGGVGDSRQGRSVSLSADGNTAIVGGCCDDGGVGAVWVYTRSGNVWAQQGGKLVGMGAVGFSNQGFSVALSADGNTAIVGGPGDDGDTGAAWVFTRSGGVWTQQGNKLIGTGAVGFAAQGFSVSVSADGNTAILGGLGDDGDNGAAWVFTRSGGVWTQQGNKLVGTGAVGSANQGASVALSGDSNTAIVGGLFDDGGMGAAWVFTRSGGVWTQQGGKLVGSGAIAPFSFQGQSVSLSSDGATAIVGGPADDDALGAAWVFTRSGGVWAEQAKLIGTGGIGEMAQGSAVSLSGNGNTALVGGAADNDDAGAAWVFLRSGTVWSQLGMKLTGAGVSGHGAQGASVALSGNGATAIVGAPFDGGGVGAAAIYRQPSPVTLPLACTSPSRLGDFNADGRADLVFRRNDGLLSVVFMSGLQVASAALIGQVGVEWTLVGIGDFNGDAKADLLFRRGDGTMLIILMNGAQVLAAQVIGTVGTEWKVVGVGDVNGDGRADILTRRTDGSLALYLVNGFQVVAAQLIGIVGMEWTVAQVADFNGDGRADVLMRRNDGAIAVYLMNGFQVLSATVIGTIGTEWRVIAAADFNSDARADFMARRADGTLAVYLMNGTQVLAAQMIGSVGLEWAFVGTGDFNADGRGDLMFRRADGTVSAYLVDGFNILVADQFNVGAEWASCYGEGGGGTAVVARAGRPSGRNTERTAQMSRATRRFCSAQ